MHYNKYFLEEKMNKKIVCFLSLSLFLFYFLGNLYSQTDSNFKSIKKIQIQSQMIKAQFSKTLGSSISFQQLNNNLTKNGFKALTADKNYYGYEETFEAENNGEKEIVTIKLYIQDYKNGGSKDVACIGQATLILGDQRDVDTIAMSTYNFELLATNGDLAGEKIAVKEFMYDPLQKIVIPANSWWTCVKDKCTACGGLCAKLAVSCFTTGTWAGYLGCIVPCGICLIKAIACCTCNCKWWCKWLVGCCHS
jgi:hypothetical protein